MHPNAVLVRRFFDAQQRGDPPVLMDLLADDAVWHVPGKNLLSRDYSGKAAVAGFWAHARELSGGTVRAELLDILGSDTYGIAMVRVFAERAGRHLDGAFQAWVYRIENGKIAEFWFMVEDRYAVDAFWS